MSKERPASPLVQPNAIKTAKPPCQIDPKAIISEKAILVGVNTVTIGANAVIHPYAKLDSTHGPITVGQFSIVAERATVGLASPHSSPWHIHVGDYVSIETGAVVESAVVGQATTVGSFATLEPGSQTGKFCKIAPSTKLANGTILSDYTVLFESGQTRTDQTTATRDDVQQLKLKGQTMHVETLRRLIPTNVAKWQ
ncbi:hypothetical protein K461DRAFT_292593 [Myriangium duriaei CBS 260.36]|uniref:Dynactin subunit 6 n=1 Tax=Myriangium duriaei CBS 260.36 TaxID=1168546 RepID=A0A9P4J1S3_9PEZI|nr:hypothetical protein K461DRAFT_292593 [Myriangium duriaei CBS 260.36]